MSKGFEVPTKKDYRSRSSHLLELGFNSYKAYLGSELYSRIRNAVLERDDSTCQVRGCDKPANVIHHERYSKEALEGSSLDEMVSLCHRHHTVVHTNAGDKWVKARPLSETETGEEYGRPS